MTEFNPITIAKDRQEVVQELLTKTWGELETIEYYGYLLFPHTIVKLRANGEREKIVVMLRVPREPQLRKARIAARAWATDEGLDPALDADLFDNMDTLCILSDCIRNRTAPHEPWVPDPKELERDYDRPIIDATWARIEGLRRVIDPRPDDINENTFLGLVAMLAAKAEIDPLAVLDSDGQSNFILRMASRLQNFLESKS